MLIVVDNSPFNFDQQPAFSAYKIIVVSSFLFVAAANLRSRECQRTREIVLGMLRREHFYEKRSRPVNFGSKKAPKTFNKKFVLTRKDVDTTLLIFVAYNDLMFFDSLRLIHTP